MQFSTGSDLRLARALVAESGHSSALDQESTPQLEWLRIKIEHGGEFHDRSFTVERGNLAKTIHAIWDPVTESQYPSLAHFDIQNRGRVPGSSIVKLAQGVLETFCSSGAAQGADYCQMTCSKVLVEWMRCQGTDIGKPECHTLNELFKFLARAEVLVESPAGYPYREDELGYNLSKLGFQLANQLGLKDIHGITIGSSRAQGAATS